MKEIDKIIKSKTAPKSNNVLWDDGENLKIYRNGKWENTVGSVPMLNVKYAELVELRNNGKLVAGMQYRIIDYVTTTAQENTRSAGHQFDIIVTADDEKTLNEVASVACIKEFDIKRYYRGFSPTWNEAMTYVGLYEHNGKTYYQYMSASEDLQMLVDFTENVENADTVDAIVLRYPFLIKPSHARYYEDGDWQEWDTGEVQGEIVGFNANPDILYFHNANAKMEAWHIWYSLDNDTQRFAWADAENGKGVIYRMIDEWGNDCPYDFKSIQFKRNLNFDNGYAQFSEDGEETWVYTFAGQSYHINNDEYSGMLDGSLESPFGHMSDEGTSTFHDNTIKPYIVLFNNNEIRTKCGLRYLNDIVFLGYWEKIGSANDEDMPYYYAYCCYCNSFENDCHSNSFGNNCYYNSFGSNCRGNSFGNDCSYNNFEVGCFNNSFMDHCKGNIFGYNCFKNIFGESCIHNSFRDHCNYNSFRESCSFNSLEVGCSNNSLGANCYYNSFGNECCGNSFVDNDGIADRVYYNQLDDEVRFVKFYYDENKGYYSGDLKNHHICRGVKNRNVEIYAGRDYETFYAINSTGEMVEFVLADLKNS